MQKYFLQPFHLYLKNRGRCNRGPNMPVFGDMPQVQAAELEKARSGDVSVLGKRKGPDMVSGMPLQFGNFSGHLHPASKSVAKKIVTEHVPDALHQTLPTDMEKPALSIVDMATIIHSYSPKKFVDGRRQTLGTWRSYAEHLVEEFLYRDCSRGADVEVVLAFDKRAKVPPVKAFAHAARGTKNEKSTRPVPATTGIIAAAGAAAGSAVAHKFMKQKKARPNPEPLWESPKVCFGFDDPTPRPEQWQQFLSNRQNRDNVFAVICRYIRWTLECARHKAGNGQPLSLVEGHLSRMQLRVDGEPVPSDDFTSTQRYAVLSMVAA